MDKDSYSSSNNSDELIIYVCQSSEKKITKKIALGGYAYTKRGAKGDIAYWYCDQRKICGASLIERDGAYTVQEDKYRRTKRGWGPDGNHSAHLPDFKRIEKEISTRVRRLETKHKRQEKKTGGRKRVVAVAGSSTHTSVAPPHSGGTAVADDDDNNQALNERRVDSETLFRNEQVPSQEPDLRIDNVYGSDAIAGDEQNGRNDHLHHENPVLIDTDGGIYDAWALSLALSNASSRAHGNKIPMTDFHLVGITTVNGSTSISNAVRNVQRVIHESGNVSPVPIFKGMESSLLGQKGNTPRPAFFGSDGFGDPKDLPPMESHETPAWIEKDHAVNGIIKLAEMYKGRLTIIALGPLTNLAMAVKLKPEIRNYIKEIFIVGGNAEGVGNMTVNSEFNFFVDPEAANITLESYHSCPIYLLPWETCIRSAASTLAFRTSIIGTLGTPLVKLFNKIEASILKKHGDQWIAPDAVIVACFLNREIMRKTENHYCTVELQGKYTRGMMIVDRNFLRQHPANVTLITEVDRTALENMFIEAMTMTEGRDIQKQNVHNHFQERSKEHHSRTSFKIEQNYF